MTTWAAMAGVLGLGGLAGAPWWALLGAGLVYAATLVPAVAGRGVRALLLVAAPAGIGATAAGPGIQELALLGAMVLAVVPFMTALGPGVPWRPLPWFFAAALLPVALLRFSPGAHLARSDLAVRVDVALLAVGLLLASAFAPFIGRRAQVQE